MGIRMDHVAEDHVSYLFRFDRRTLDCLADHGGRQLRRGFVLQTSTIISNGGANTAQDHNFWLCHLLSPLLLFVFSSFVSIRRTLFVFRSSLHGLSFPLAWWFLPSLVVVEATPTLASEPASGHHLAQERGSSEPWLFERLEQHISSVEHGIEPTEVAQRQWPHGIARPQHHADVDILFGRESLLKHVNRIEQVRREQVIDDKASAVLAHNHALSQTLTHRTDGFERLVRGGEGTHELDQLHGRHRIEEVHAQHAAWPLRGCRQLNNGNRTRVACQDRVWWADLIELLKQLLLEVQVLNGCFNHQVAIGEVFQPRRAPHPAARRLLVC